MIPLREPLWLGFICAIACAAVCAYLEAWFGAGVLTFIAGAYVGKMDR